MEPDDTDPVFKYIENASSRAGISSVTRKLEIGTIAIVGLGGTGSYVLDLVAKTPVKKIHLYDGDDFLQHNAFRAPGAASIDELKKVPKKVNYWADRYAPMRNGIIPHYFHIDAWNVDCLEGMDFVFLCMDAGYMKPPIIKKLDELGVPFIDVGMGVMLVDGKLLGILRVTTSTPNKRDHLKKRISFAGGGAGDEYSNNIQIAELNSISAAMAVIKWKKLCGFYFDLQGEHSCTYTLDGNVIMNDDR